jgi:cell division septal protein FtsQ
VNLAANPELKQQPTATMSWFKRKQSNRRLQARHVLDVKLRSNRVRAARLRFAGLLLSFLFGTVFVLFAIWRGGEWLLDRLIFQNEALAVQTIEVQTDGVIAIEHLRRWAMVKTGQNILALDLAKVRRDLELVPWIQSAAVERIPPNTIRIRVSEREPIAQVVLPRLLADGSYDPGIFYLDEHGVVTTPIDPRVRSVPAITNLHLPFITGVQANELRLGRPVESPQVRAALELIAAFENSAMAQVVELDRINISVPEVLQLYTTQNAEVTFSLSQFDVQLNRWWLIHDHWNQFGKAISTLDLSISNYLPMHFVDVDSLPPAPPKAPKPQRNRKKNV